MTPTAMMRTSSGGRPHFDCARPLPLLLTKTDAKLFFSGSPEWAAQEAEVLAQLPKSLKEAEAVLLQRQQVAESSRQTVDDSRGGFKRPTHYIHMPIAPRHLNMLSVPGKRLCSYSLRMPDFEFLAAFNGISPADAGNVDSYESSGLLLKSSEFNVIVDCWSTISHRDNVNLTEAEARVLVREYLKLSHITSATVKAIYDHWSCQRRAKGRPMLRHLVACNQDNGPFGVFRPRQKEKMNLRRQRRQHKDGSQKILHLEQDLNKVLAILERMRIRDSKKLQLFKMQCIVFDQKRHELIDPSFRSPLWPLAARLRQVRKRGALQLRPDTESCEPRPTGGCSLSGRVREGRHNRLVVDRFLHTPTDWSASGGNGWVPPPNNAGGADNTRHQEVLLEASREGQCLALGAGGIPGCGPLSAGSAPAVDTEPTFMYPPAPLSDDSGLLLASAGLCAFRPS